MAQSDHPDPKRQCKAKSGNEAEVAINLQKLPSCIANESCLQAVGGPAISAQAPAQVAPRLDREDRTIAGLLKPQQSTDTLLLYTFHNCLAILIGLTTHCTWHA